MKPHVFINPRVEAGPITLAKAAIFAATVGAALTTIIAMDADVFDLLQPMQSMLSSINNVIKDTAYGNVITNDTYDAVVDIAIDTESIKRSSADTATRISAVVTNTQNTVAKLTAVEALLATIEANVATMTGVQALMHTQNANLMAMLTTKLDAILRAIEAVNAPGSFLKRMNAAANGLSATSLVSLDFTGDVCEYDPLGFGPIECEGTEILKTDMQGIKFTFV